MTTLTQLSYGRYRRKLSSIRQNHEPGTGRLGRIDSRNHQTARREGGWNLYPVLSATRCKGSRLLRHRVQFEFHQPFPPPPPPAPPPPPFPPPPPPPELASTVTATLLVSVESLLSV